MKVPGPWKYVTSLSGHSSRVFDLPLAAIAEQEVWDEETGHALCPLDEIVDWVGATRKGKLPNGWKYNLSDQVYLSADKVCYESKGVPVDVKVLNTKKDLAQGRDSVVAKALQLLKDR